MNEIDLYLVESEDGKYLRRKGYGGYGDSWVTDISLARMYGKIGLAKAQITYWGKHYPEFPVPHIVKYKAVPVEVIEQAKRVKKAISEAEVREQKYKENALKRKIKDYEKELEKLRREWDEQHN